MIKVKIPMKKIALIAALFLFAGVITVLFACTPEAHTNFDADKTFSRLLEEVRYSAELEDASEYSDYILSDLPEGTDVKMYICGGSHADAVALRDGLAQRGGVQIGVMEAKTGVCTKDTTR